MRTNQQVNTKFFSRASFRQRVIAGIVFVAIAGLFVFLSLAAAGKFDIGLWLGPCGVQQQYGLPCPTCGITTSALAFAEGRIVHAFYIQPAGGLMCVLLAFAGFLALLTAVFGVYFSLLARFIKEIKIRYIILALIVIIAAGWAVTLARELIAGTSG